MTENGLREMYLVVKSVFRSATAPRYIVENEVIHRHPDNQSDREAILSLDVFKELGILKEETSPDGMMLYRWCHIKEKLELITSLTFLKYSS